MDETETKLTCRICRADARLAPNPYFGTGLSVHSHIQVCTRCGAISFPPAPERDAAAAPSSGAAPGWGARVRSWLGAS